MPWHLCQQASERAKANVIGYHYGNFGVASQDAASFEIYVVDRDGFGNNICHLL